MGKRRKSIYAVIGRQRRSAWKRETETDATTEERNINKEKADEAKRRRGKKNRFGQEKKSESFNFVGDREMRRFYGVLLLLSLSLPLSLSVSVSVSSVATWLITSRL